MQKLWSKKDSFNPLVETFETKGDLELDQQLVIYDVWGSLAHAQGLHHIGLLSDTEVKQLQQGLLEIIHLNQLQQFQLQPGDEDIHTKIENFLTEHYGEVGKKIHTGRSRNDQVLTAIRLFTKDQLLQVWSAAIELIEALVRFATLHQSVAMPGYTHLQKAMPSSVGLWAGALATGLMDDLYLLAAAYELNDQSPLGSAAGYGVPLPLNRALTAQLLGFAKVQTNPLSCQNSRGKNEAAVVASLVAFLQDVNKLANDTVLFSTSEFNFFQIASEYCSGSSIMPQKKNVDVAELLRSKVHQVLANYTHLVSLSSNLPSGYNRDLQDSKKPLFESLATTGECLQIAALLVNGITIHQTHLQQALTPELFATHHALDLVQQGVPFRTAYQQVAATYQSLTMPTALLTPAEWGFTDLQQQLTQQKNLHHQATHKFQSSINSLISMKGKNEKKD